MWFLPNLLVEILFIFSSNGWFFLNFLHFFFRFFVQEMIWVRSNFFRIWFLFIRFYSWSILLSYFIRLFIQFIFVGVFFFIELLYAINIFFEISIFLFFKFLFFGFTFTFLFLGSWWWFMFMSFYFLLFNFFSIMVEFANTLPIVCGIINIVIIDQICWFIIFVIIFFDFAKWITAEKLRLCLYHCFMLNTILLLLCHFTKLTFSNFFLFTFSLFQLLFFFLLQLRFLFRSINIFICPKLNVLLFTFGNRSGVSFFRFVWWILFVII